MPLGHTHHRAIWVHLGAGLDGGQSIHFPMTVEVGHPSAPAVRTCCCQAGDVQTPT